MLWPLAFADANGLMLVREHEHFPLPGSVATLLHISCPYATL